MPPCDPPHSACGDPGPINYVNSSSSSSRSSRLNCFALNQNEQRTGPNRDYQRQLPGRRFGPKAAQKPSQLPSWKAKNWKLKSNLGRTPVSSHQSWKRDGQTDVGQPTTYNLQTTTDSRQRRHQHPGAVKRKTFYELIHKKGQNTHTGTPIQSHIEKGSFLRMATEATCWVPSSIHSLPHFPVHPSPFAINGTSVPQPFLFFFCRVVCQNNMLKHRCEECCFFNLVVFYFPKRFAKVEKGCQKWGFPFFVTLFVFPFDFCCLCLPSVCNFSFSGCI